MIKRQKIVSKSFWKVLTVFSVFFFLLAVNSEIIARYVSKSSRLKEKEMGIDLDKVPKFAKGSQVFSKALPSKMWYIKMSSQVSYFNLGADLQKTLNKVNGMFAGDSVSASLLVFDTNFSMMTDKTVARADTHFVPTGNLGIGFVFKKIHQLEFDMGIAGLVPLNTIHAKTGMTMKENKVCSRENLNDCPMAKLGMVNYKTGKGRYDMEVNINEKIWLFTPSVWYDFIFMKKRWGRLSVGGSLGLVIMSASQHVELKATRQKSDLDINKDNEGDAYKARSMEGSASSTAINDVGPIARLYMGYKRAIIKGLMSEIRLGVNYGFVNLHRNVDGKITAILGNETLPASFSTASVGFKQQETNKLEMLGFFFQAGMVF